MGSDLSELLARVEAAKYGNVNLDVDVLDAVWPDWRAHKDDEAFYVTSSLDAALAPVARLLPCWVWPIASSSPKFNLTGDPRPHAGLYDPKPFATSVVSVSTTPALALCAAILLALLASAQQDPARDGATLQGDSHE